MSKISDPIQRIHERKNIWKARHAESDEITSRLKSRSIESVARSHDLLARTEPDRETVKKTD